jgi:hypothetical protein
VVDAEHDGVRRRLVVEEIAAEFAAELLSRR